MSILKRTLSVVLIIAMLMTCMPQAVFAEEPENTAETTAVETTESTVPETTEAAASEETEPLTPEATEGPDLETTEDPASEETEPSVSEETGAPTTETTVSAGFEITVAAAAETEMASQTPVTGLDACPALTGSLSGKTVSILGDSISTYAGVSNNTAYNSTIGGNAVYYSAGRFGVYQSDTWWQQVIDVLGLRLLVNNSWSGSCVLNTRSGTAGAYVSRCVQLHDDVTGETPDIILIFLGTNDFSYYSDTWGTDAAIDYSQLILQNADGTYTYAEPATTCEAYAILLHKLRQCYPDAAVYCMTPMARRDPDYTGDDKADVGQPTACNQQLKLVAERFGCNIIDMEGCVSSAAAEFDLYMGDYRVHPNKLGMDAMTETVVSGLLGQAVTVYDISFNLTNVTAGGVHAVQHGNSYTATLTEADGFFDMAVTVTMGDQDITESCYADGVVSIPAVTGDVAITAQTISRDPLNFRWEFDGSNLASVTTDGNTENTLTKLAGSVSDGVFSDTRYEMDRTVLLLHNRPWVMEWKATGDWSAMLLTSTPQSATDGMTFVFRTYNATGLLAMGTYSGGSYHNYGIALADHGLDMTQVHTYRLENRIASDGSNMVYLLVDGTELGAMNNYYIGGTNNQNQTVDWVSGKDFEFGFMGSTSHPLKNMALEYLQIYESGLPETQGHKTISILGASISTFGGISNGDAADTANSTIRNNAAYYPLDTIPDITLTDTWWMQVAEDMDLRLLVNNAWSGSSLLHTRNGTVGAYVDRCVQLHDDTGENAGEEPDIIGIQMGTNDYQYYKDTLGTAAISYDTLIVDNGDGTYTYAEPTTSLEAAAIVMHKISIRYPDAEVYYLNLSQRVDITDETAGVLETFNENLATVCAHFGVTIVDIYNSGITQDNFGTYIGDNRVHPNRFGMDAYTEAFKKALLGEHPELTAYTVDFQLDNVTADYGVDKQVLLGKSFTCTLTAPEYFKCQVTITMDGVDITDSCYSDGVVTIEAVTGPVAITAEAVMDHDPVNYRWEFDGTDLATVTTDGNVENVLTKLAGSTTDGVFTSTNYSLDKTVVLSHELPWSVEWKSEGSWKNSSTSGGRLFSSAATSSNDTRYIFKSVNSYLIAMGERTGSGSYNYGIALADHGIDGAANHVYRLENRISEDGSNMVWLYVDGVEIGPMNNLFIGTTDQNTVSDGLSGMDFLLPYIGTTTHGLNNCSIDYVQVWEGGSDHYHTYAAEVTEPTYTTGGYTTYTCSGCGHSFVDDYTDPIALHTYRWELVEDTFVSVTTDGAEENQLLLQNGSITDGAFSNVLYNVDTSIHLYHDQPWVIEWKSSGDNARTAGSTSGGSGMLSSNAVLRSEEGTWFLYKRPGNYLIALCYRDTTTSVQSGIALVDHGIDGSELHTYRLENRIAEDGTNMVYLSVDGAELGAMNNLFVSAVDQGETTDFLNGLDWTFNYMGITNYYLNNCSVEYMQIWEGGQPSSYEGKVISIMGDSISTFAGYIPVADGFNREHLARYPQDNLLTDVNETWWMQVVVQLDAKLGINDSWRGSTLSGAVPVTTGDTGENAAMSNLTRIQNLGSNGTPDVILLYGGTNDLAHVSSVGTFDPATAPATVDLTTTKWDNLADGFVHTLLRMRYYYPEAVIVALLPAYTASYYSDEKLEQGNGVMAQICQHYGIPYVDLRDSGVTASFLPDGIHPGEEGMDLITAAVVEKLLSSCEVTAGEHVVYGVSHALTNVTATLGHWKGVDAGSAFVEILTGDDMAVSVAMGGVDITQSCYADGIISIDCVTGDLVITAKASFSLGDRLQALPEDYYGVNLWPILRHDADYYSVDGWAVHSSGNVKSVTIPVQPGEQLYASSFGAAGSNGGSSNGIRVTYFSQDGLLKTMSSNEVYAEFSTNGYLTVPESAVAVSIPMWTNSEDWVLKILEPGIPVNPYLEGHLQQLPENAYNTTNLWTELTPENCYYSADGWITSYPSVTVPVCAGDQLWATSFQESGTNGGGRNGIRVTYFSQTGMLVSVSPDDVYTEFSAKGYLTVPEDAVAVCIPMWTQESAEFYILTLPDLPVTSVDIQWGAMEFVYTPGAWDLDTYTYAEGVWTPEEESNFITVTNTGNTIATVSFRYENAEGFDLTASFSRTEAALPVAAEQTVWLTLSGKPKAFLSQWTTLGTVTVLLE